VTSMLQQLRPKFYAQSRAFYVLFGLTVLLVAFGLAMVASASAVDSFKATSSASQMFLRQAAFAGLGLVAMLAAATMPLGFYKRIAGVFLLGTIGAQLFTVLFGVTINGNRNWINVFGFSVQPSEFLKLALALSVALLLSKLGEDHFENRRTWLQIFLVSGVSIALVAIAGRDMGTGVVIALMLMGMLLLGGMGWLSWFGLAAAGSLFGVLGVISSPSRRVRFDAWLNPDAHDALGVNWQFEHGTYALAAGGWFGSGLGRSKLKWSWIPEVHNDFIFAVIGEELGLIGAAFVILMFFAIGIAMYLIAKRQHDAFARNVVTGVMLWITLQAFINIGVVLGLFPVLGVPLPLVSAGGSALISNLAAIGVVLAIERHRARHPLGAARA
jgi:cell division protein FtsW